MKIEKYLSILFAVAAAALVAAAAIGYACFWQTPPMIQTPVEEAEARTEVLMEAICRGDYSAAGESLYGTPELRWNPDAASELGTLLWEGYSSTLSYAFSGPCYATGTGIYRDVTVTALDIPPLSPKIQERFLLLLETQLADAQYDSEAFDENGVLRQEFTADVLHQAVEQILQEDNACTSYQITLELVFENGQWWVLPKQSLIDIAAGVMTQ